MDMKTLTLIWSEKSKEKGNFGNQQVLGKESRNWVGEIPMR